MIYQLLELCVSKIIFLISLWTSRFENRKFGIFSSVETSNPRRKKGRAKVVVLSDHPSIHQPVISPGKHLKRREQKHYVCQPRVSRLSDSFTPESFVTRSTRFTFRQSEFPGRTIVSSLVAGGCGCTPLSSDVTTRLCSFRSLCKRGGEWRNRGFATPSIDEE